jgi:hypothetical protein
MAAPAAVAFEGFLTIADLAGMGYDIHSNKKDSEELRKLRIEEWDAYIRSHPKHSPIFFQKFQFGKFEDYSCNDIFGELTKFTGEVAECFEDPTLKVSHGFYAVTILYHDGSGNLITPAQNEKLIESDLTQYCDEGERQSLHDAAYYYNPNVEERYYDKDVDYKSFACCPYGTFFNGEECEQSDDILESRKKYERTDTQWKNLLCKREKGLDYEYLGPDAPEEKEFSCSKVSTSTSTTTSKKKYHFLDPNSNSTDNSNSTETDNSTSTKKKYQFLDPTPSSISRGMKTKLTNQQRETLFKFRKIAIKK